MDWTLLVLVLAFAVRGWMRGFLPQLFTLVGFVLGAWLAGWLAVWVGRHWMHARPIVVFRILKFLVILFGALAMVALFRWLGAWAKQRVDHGPLAVLEGPGGLLLGTFSGLLIATIAMWLALQTSWPSAISVTASHSRLAAPMMKGATRAWDAVQRFTPGWEFLSPELHRAERRALAAR